MEARRSESIPRAGKRRSSLRQAKRPVEGEEGEDAGPAVDSRGSELTRQASDAQFVPLPGRESTQPATGQVIGKMTPRASSLLESQDDVPELPFTRKSKEIGDTEVYRTPPPPPPHRSEHL